MWVQSITKTSRVAVAYNSADATQSFLVPNQPPGTGTAWPGFLWHFGASSPSPLLFNHTILCAPCDAGVASTGPWKPLPSLLSSISFPFSSVPLARSARTFRSLPPRPPPTHTDTETPSLSQASAFRAFTSGGWARLGVPKFEKATREMF